MLYIFDLDGTLIESFLHEGNQIHPFERVELLPNRLIVLRELALFSDSRFAICSNQAGVAFEKQTIRETQAKIGRTLVELEFFFGHAYSIHVCYTHPKATLTQFRALNDPRRKPNPGMLFQAGEAHRVRPEQTIYVGDMNSDREAAERAVVQFAWADSFFDLNERDDRRYP